MSVTLNINLKNDLLDGIDTVFNNGTRFRTCQCDLRCGRGPAAMMH